MNRSVERDKSWERAELFRTYRANPGEALRNQLVEAYLHIARIIALRFAGKGVEFDDLYQVSSLALIKAVERFDPDYGVQFQSYATPKMVGEVKNYFRDKLHALSMPRKGSQLIKQIDAARAELSQKLLRSPTLGELIQFSGLSEAEVVEALVMQGAMHPGSLDKEIEQGETPLSAFLGREDIDFDRFEVRESVAQALSRLGETEQAVLRERFFNELSQREVAEKLGVSQMTISRIERRALSEVKQMLVEGE